MINILIDLDIFICIYNIYLSSISYLDNRFGMEYDHLGDGLRVLYYDVRSVYWMEVGSKNSSIIYRIRIVSSL